MLVVMFWAREEAGNNASANSNSSRTVSRT
jgi:hypothetical protein